MDSLAFVATDTFTMLRRLFVDLFALRDASTEIVKSQMSVVAISDSSDQIVPFSANATVTPNAPDLINLTSALTVIIFPFTLSSCTILEIQFFNTFLQRTFEIKCFLNFTGLNNTMGPQCTRCKPLFVGDPRNNGQCISCFEYCNGHTPVCHGHNFSLANVSSELLRMPWTKAAETAWIELIHEGPKTQAVCHSCFNLTMGEKCEECIPGNFRGSEDKRKPCRPCECHGHGDMCHQVTGEGTSLLYCTGNNVPIEFVL